MAKNAPLRAIVWHGRHGLPGLKRVYAWRHAPGFHAMVRDTWNLLRYGADAPRFAEQLWVNPRSVLRYDRKGLVWKSARVVTGEWPERTERPIETDPILQAAIARWVHGASWEQSGEVERMEQAIRRRPGHGGCFSRRDILKRCEGLDRIFEVIQREGRVRSMRELHPGNFREGGGIGMHFGPDGAAVRAGNGRHRFAMAWVLDLPVIPVRVGLVHFSALPIMKRLRLATPAVRV